MKRIKGNKSKQQPYLMPSTTGTKRDLLRIELPEHFGPSHKTLSVTEKQALNQMKNAEDAITMLKKVCNVNTRIQK